MLRKLNTWRKALGEKSKLKRFNDGVCFAKACVLQGEDKVNHVLGLVEEARAFGTYDEFDKGIESVLGTTNKGD
jgi:hypothetical protein